MLQRYTLAVLFACFALSVSAQEKAGTAESNQLPAFNQKVLEIIKTYPTDGTHGYWWPRNGESSYDGCTTDMYLGGKKVMDGEEKGRTFCCGVTLEVFLRAYDETLEEGKIADEKQLVADDWPKFQKYWFVREKNGPGPSDALEEFDLGRKIPRKEALPGDFVQIWRRSGSGHSVIFLDWVKNDEGEITGFRYWSTQPSSNGIAERTEYFGAKDADQGVADEHTHWARVEIPEKDAQQ